MGQYNTYSIPSSGPASSSGTVAVNNGSAGNGFALQSLLTAGQSSGPATSGGSGSSGSSSSSSQANVTVNTGASNGGGYSGPATRSNGSKRGTSGNAAEAQTVAASGSLDGFTVFLIAVGAVGFFWIISKLLLD